ncbi:hypothetical protein C8J57DRAFT_1324364, partial [Mycena rebaudengoi]
MAYDGREFDLDIHRRLRRAAHLLVSRRHVPPAEHADNNPLFRTSTRGALLPNPVTRASLSRTPAQPPPQQMAIATPATKIPPRLCRFSCSAMTLTPSPRSIRETRTAPSPTRPGPTSALPSSAPLPARLATPRMGRRWVGHSSCCPSRSSTTSSPPLCDARRGPIAAIPFPSSSASVASASSFISPPSPYALQLRARTTRSLLLALLYPLLLVHMRY